MINSAFAQIIKFKGEAGCIGQEGVNYFICKIVGVVNIFYWLGIILGIGILMYSGFRYIASPGKGFKEEIPYVILGIALIIASFSIQVILISFLK